MRMRRKSDNTHVHPFGPYCNDDECEDVEQVTAETTKLPEFEIAISYHHFPSPNGIFVTGWKYTLHWKNKKGEPKIAYKFGHETQHAARMAAESKATSEALAETATVRYNFTPEVD